MKIRKPAIATIAIGALILASNAFAGGISSKENTMRGALTKCISDIQNPASKISYDRSGHTPLDVTYHELGGAYKYCSSVANNTRKAITAGYDQQEKWDEEAQSLLDEYMALPNQERAQAHGMSLWKKIGPLLVKLEGRNAQSKLVIYREMMKNLDKLDALLPSIEGM